MRIYSIKIAFRFCLALLILSCSSFSFSQPKFSENNFDSGRLVRMQKVFPLIQEMFDDYAKEHHFPSIVFGIVSEGKLVYAGSSGYADLENKIPASSKSLYRIASMSKSFTAMAILILRDQGKLKLDDAVSLYIPEMKNVQYLTSDAPAITIRHLLTHAAGFPEDNPWGDRQLAIADTTFSRWIKEGFSYSNVPGIAYEYSNTGYALLGRIISNVSGIPYDKYITQNILLPLGMDRTTFEFSAIPPDQFAKGYRWQNGKWELQPALHHGAYGSMGGMISSIEDFSKYIIFQLAAWPPRNGMDEGVIKRSSVREMQHPWNFASLQPNYAIQPFTKCAVANAYGYGLRWTRDCEGRTFVGHSGGLPGYGSDWKILADYDLGIVAFSNLTYGATGKLNMLALDTLITLAKLKKKNLLPSEILETRKSQLMEVLPYWEEDQSRNIFADNFFLDYSIDLLKKESVSLFKQSGNIKAVSAIFPENNLRGYFIIYGEKHNLRIDFTLTPEKDPKTQEYHLKMIR